MLQYINNKTYYFFYLWCRYVSQYCFTLFNPAWFSDGILLSVSNHARNSLLSSSYSRTTLRSLRISRWQDNTLSSSVISVPSFSMLYSLLRSYTQIYICSHHKNCNNMDIPFLMLYLFQVKLRFHIFYIPVSSIFSPFILGTKKTPKILLMPFSKSNILFSFCSEKWYYFLSLIFNTSSSEIFKSLQISEIG